MQLMTHAACVGLSHNREGSRKAGLLTRPMAGYWPDRWADATATARRVGRRRRRDKARSGPASPAP